MAVFSVFFGRRGVVGFKASLLGASSGVVGFNVATLSRQSALPRSCRRRGARGWLRWGFCSIRSWLAACRRRVVPLMTPFPPFDDDPAEPPPGGLTCAVTNARATTATNQSNFACNSPECISAFGVRSLSFQRFVACGDSRLWGNCMRNLSALALPSHTGHSPHDGTAPRPHDGTAPRQAGPAPARPSCASALDDVDGQAALGRLLVLREHVVAGLAHRLDDDVQAHRVPTVAP